MPLRKLADDTVAKIDASIAADMSDGEREQVARIVEQAIIDAVNSAAQHYADTTSNHFGHDADKAHKLSEAMKRAKTALVSNLQGLR